MTSIVNKNNPDKPLPAPTLKKYFERENASLKVALKYAQSNAKVRMQLEALRDEIVETNKAGGKVIFTGIGKNVFACQKLAASYSSIGIPSFFLDAVHAVHGDLGVIKPNDMIIAMSKSGNTSELINMLNHLDTYKKRFPNQVWGIDCNPQSENGFEKYCDDAIHINSGIEIDEFNKVPTASAIILQIIGDIVGVAASEELGFDLELFGLNHPGGTIGESLKKEESV